jgi:hypothetical protein
MVVPHAPGALSMLLSQLERLRRGLSRHRLLFHVRLYINLADACCLLCLPPGPKGAIPSFLGDVSKTPFFFFFFFWTPSGGLTRMRVIMNLDPNIFVILTLWHSFASRVSTGCTC